MASGGDPEEVSVQQEELTGHAAHKPALVVGGFAEPVGTKPATTSRRFPQSPEIAELTDGPERFHRDASMPRFDNLEITSSPQNDRSPPVYPVPAPGQTSGSESPDESLPASPTKEQVKNKLAAEEQSHSQTKAKLASEEQSHSQTKAKLASEEQSHSQTKAKLASEEQSHSQTKAQLEVERERNEQLEEDLADFRDEVHKLSLMLLDSQEDKRQLDTANRQLDTANRQLDTSNRQLDTANRQLDTSNRQLETKLKSLTLAYESLVQKAGAENTLTQLLQGIDSGSYDRLLVIFIANAFQAHIQKLICWGCFQRNDKRIHSHAYGEAMLREAAVFCLTAPETEEKDKKKIGTKQLFWLHGEPRSAGKCILPVLRECLCRPCDESTCDWEKALGAQFANERIMLTINGICKGKEDITELVLLMQVFRGAMMSVDLQHMRTCPNCQPYFVDVFKMLRSLAEIHHSVCVEIRESKQEVKDVREKCRELGSTIFYSTEHKHDHLIEYPLVAIVPNIGPVIYAQIPPYYIAIPTYRKREFSRDLMEKIIRGVNLELLHSRQSRFYEDTVGAKDWKDNLIREGCRPMMVFPCPNICCIDLSQ